MHGWHVSSVFHGSEFCGLASVRLRDVSVKCKAWDLSRHCVWGLATYVSALHAACWRGLYAWKAVVSDNNVVVEV